MQLSELNKALTSTVALKEQQSLLEDFEILISSLKSTKPLLKVLLNQAITAENNVKEKIKASKVTLKKQVFVNLFNVIADATTTELQLEDNAFYFQFRASWQNGMRSALVKESNKVLREQITLELEILANIESPDKFSEQRLAVQVQMLSDKMVQGEEVNVTTKLKQWLNCGPLLENEKALLARIKPIFIR